MYSQWLDIFNDISTPLLLRLGSDQHILADKANPHASQVGLHSGGLYSIL